MFTARPCYVMIKTDCCHKASKACCMIYFCQDHCSHLFLLMCKDHAPVDPRQLLCLGYSCSEFFTQSHMVAEGTIARKPKLISLQNKGGCCNQVEFI